MTKLAAVHYRRSPPPALLLLHLFLLFPNPAKSTDIIDKICKATPFFDLCEASLSPITNATDPKSIAATMAAAVLGNITETLTLIKLRIRSSRDPAEERALAECAELYRPVVRFNIPQAIDAMRRGQFGFAAYVLADAGKQADYCQKGINSSGGGGSPLSARNKTVKNLCDVAISVMRLLQKGG